MTAKTRIGQRIINQETPWSVSQWSRLLLVLSITLFILVDPIFHLLTFAIFAILYYVFVNKNLLNTNIRKLGVKNDMLPGNLSFSSINEFSQEITCIPIEERSLYNESRAIDRCLFSFPYIENKAFPMVNYLNGEYHLKLNLTSEKFTSSLVDNLKKAGFEVILKNK